jgi:2-polyprenyl-3-methyl-5-hydroxy-6-metoxy-1,4-benzoquinol methylase
MINKRMSSFSNSVHLSKCRICDSKELLSYLELGVTPLANSYLRKEQLDKPEFKEELKVVFCNNCSHSQLTRVVNPDLMFKNYIYVSSTTATFNRHCDKLAANALKLLQPSQKCLVLDIASNDGCLLTKFKKQGCRVIGIDPAKNLAEEANCNGIPTINAYWNSNVANKIRKEYGIPSIITCTNVIAHVHDVHHFVSAVKSLLPEKGIFIIECPYLVDFIKRNEFDTIYHEHLSYFGMIAMKNLVEQQELEIFHHNYFPDIHGGTIRFMIGHKGKRHISEEVTNALRKERDDGFTNIYIYKDFATRIYQNKLEFKKILHALKGEKKIIWGYGASAKGNTLINYFEITNKLIDSIIDDNPKKWGLYTPGAHIKITGIEELSNKVDFVLLLAWNFSGEIMKRCRKVGYKGKFITPVPKPRIFE